MESRVQNPMYVVALGSIALLYGMVHRSGWDRVEKRQAEVARFLNRGQYYAMVAVYFV